MKKKEKRYRYWYKHLKLELEQEQEERASQKLGLQETIRVDEVCMDTDAREQGYREMKAGSEICNVESRRHSGQIRRDTLG